MICHSSIFYSPMSHLYSTHKAPISFSLLGAVGSLDQHSPQMYTEQANYDRCCHREISAWLLIYLFISFASETGMCCREVIWGGHNAAAVLKSDSRKGRRTGRPLCVSVQRSKNPCPQNSFMSHITRLYKIFPGFVFWGYISESFNIKQVTKPHCLPRARCFWTVSHG